MKNTLNHNRNHTLKHAIMQDIMIENTFLYFRAVFQQSHG